MSRWGENPFWAELKSHLERQEAGTDFARLTVDQATGLWVHRPGGDGAAPPAFLQGRRLVVDVTDESVTLYPLGWEGRYALCPGFDFASGSTKQVRALVYGIGEANWLGDGWQVTFRVSPTLPVLEVEVSGAPVEAAWVLVDGAIRNLVAPCWLEVADAGIDHLISRNNSAIPDPQPLPALRAGVLAVPRPGRIVVAVAPSESEALAFAGAWEAIRPAEADYWPAISGSLDLELPDGRLSRQARYSVHSSLFSRSVDTRGLDIFVHGRRDRGYADAAHLHQSYQMHLPALASGESHSVRDELLAFLHLQDGTGWIERAPRPIRGDSSYVGRYTSAHLLLAAERYLAWTGDREFFDEAVRSDYDPVPRRVRDRITRAADDLLAHRYRGLVHPCGWADAWNPEVRAQGQISAAAALGLRAWSETCRFLGDEPGAVRFGDEADAIAAAMIAELYDPVSGLVAEHMFADRVTGGTPADFWAHTQIWSALAGITSDGRGLDLVAENCLERGVSIAPESAFDTDYIAASTDSAADLPLDSTATWLMASWPEVTHLYALAELGRGRPDAALRAVLSQLPETLHEAEPACLPWYYAEKYLWPGTRPWLCTWAGDPSLIEVLLTGFLGVRARPDGLVVAPCWPAAWAGARSRGTFVWQGIKLVVETDPTLPFGVVTAGRHEYRAGELVASRVLRQSGGVRLSSQTFA